MRVELGAAALVLLGAVSCAESEPAALVDAAGPPPTLTLTSVGTTTPGDVFGLDVTGLTPGAPVTLLAGRGREGVDIGPCPPALGGLCLDFLPGQPRYGVVSTGTASPSGAYSWSGVVPPSLPGGTWRFQAVSTGASPAESNVVTALAGCVDDAGEPDDGVAQAGALGPAAPARVLCPADQDWYTLTVAPFEAINIAMTLSPADGDLDLELENAAGVLLDGAYTLDGLEEVTWYNNSAFPVVAYLQVFAVSDAGQDGVDYELALSRLTPQPCLPDPFEDADDLPAGAIRLAGAGVVTGHGACFGDSDWYVVNVGPTVNITADVIEASGEGDAAVYLYDAALTELAGPADPAGYVTTAGGDYFIEVVLQSDDITGGGADYELDLSLTQDRVCAADGLEPNDGAVTAEPISTGVVYPDLDSCSDEDWYAFTAAAGDTIQVDMTFLVADGDIDATLYSPALAQIASGTAASDNEVFYATATFTGTYYLKVYLYGDYGSPVIGGATYDLLVSLQ
jgi:hypothetical protein